MAEQIESLLEKVKKKPIYTVLATLVTLFILVGTLLGTWSIIVGYIFPPSEPVRTNIEFVLDASGHMKNRSLFEIAKQQLNDSLRSGSNNDVLGFRPFGHRNKGCDDTELLVKLGTKNVNKINDELSNLPSGGKALLGKAIVEAMSDFNDIKRFPSGTSKTIMVITSGSDDCDEKFLDMVRDKQRGFPELNIDFKIIGLGVENTQEAKGIEELASILHGKAYYAKDSLELKKLLDIFIIQEPFINNNRELLETLLNMTHNLNNATESLKHNELDKAKDAIDQSEVYFNRTSDLFKELESRQFDNTSQKVIKLIKDMREDQKRALSLVKEMADLLPTEDPQKIEQLKQLETSYTQVAEDYNSLGKQVESLLQNL